MAALDGSARAVVELGSSPPEMSLYLVGAMSQIHLFLSGFSACVAAR